MGADPPTVRRWTDKVHEEPAVGILLQGHKDIPAGDSSRGEAGGTSAGPTQSPAAAPQSEIHPRPTPTHSSWDVSNRA